MDVLGLIAAGAAISGALVRWTLLPLTLAFWAGLQTGKILGSQKAGRHARQTAAR